MNPEVCLCDCGEDLFVGEYMQVSIERWLVGAPVNNDTVRCSSLLHFTCLMVQ
jgi:hypothetical protein